MIAVDTNILVYAHRRESRFHTASAATIRTLAEGRDRWAIPWPCVYEFYSVVTNRRIWQGHASDPDQAWRQIEAWASSPSLALLGESEDFLGVLERIARRPRVRGPIVHDARVVAICIAHGVDEFWTLDRDFALFPELETRNPLAS
jgi:uncharacterized protein